MRSLRAALVALIGTAALAAPASAKTVGSDLEALEPTTTIACPTGASCILAQSLSGNGTPFSPPTGVISRWSVKLGAQVPRGIRLVVQDATGTAGPGQGRRTVDVGSLQQPLGPGVTSFAERLPIHTDEVFGVRLEADTREGTAATIAAPFADEYRTLLLWDPPPPFGADPYPLATRVFDDTRIAISVEVVKPSPARCDPLNLFTGSNRGDDQRALPNAGDLVRGLGGADELRGQALEDCLYGGSGDDRLWGGDGDDELGGGRGRDEVSAGQGDDLILVRDGVRDRVRCEGGRDTVNADRYDRTVGCERVRIG